MTVANTPKLRPILFSTSMVLSILQGRKTQTRRVFKDHPRLASDTTKIDLRQWLKDFPDLLFSYSQHGKPGDILWVRESYYEPLFEGLNGKYYYRAGLEAKGWDFKWKPSIHMPFDAARIFLRIKTMRVERLDEISELDAIAEGVEHLFPEGHEYHKPKDYANYTWHGRNGGNNSFSHYSGTANAKESFQSLWYLIHGKQSWKSNPWVWVIEFERITKEQALKEVGHA